MAEKAMQGGVRCPVCRSQAVLGEPVAQQRLYRSSSLAALRLLEGAGPTAENKFSMIQQSTSKAHVLVLLGLVLPWLNPFATGPSPPVVQSLVSLACAGVVMLAFVWRLDAASLTKVSAEAWLGAALLSCGIGMLQYFGLSSHLFPWVNGAAAGEAYANLRQRNQFASLTNIGLAALLFWEARNRGRKLLHVVAAVVLVIGNVASSSRTGAVQLFVLIGLALVWGGWGQPAVRRVLVAALLGYCAGALSLIWLAGLDPSANGIVARIHDSGPSCASRLVLWANVLQLIAHKPWFGWGWGELDFAHFIMLYPGPRFCDILDNAHNLPLHLAVELGLPAALFLCGLGAWLVWRARPWRETDPARRMAWAVLVLILLHSMLEYPLWYGPFQITVGLCGGILWYSKSSWISRSTASEEPEEPKAIALTWPLFKAIATSGTIALLLGVGYAAWDYHRVSQIYLAVDMRASAYRQDTLDKIRGSWLFRNQVRFAELSTTELKPDNADYLYSLASDLLHFSPEARVAEKLIDSALMLGRNDEALYYLARYRAAFPTEHASWLKANALSAGLPQLTDRAGSH